MEEEAEVLGEAAEDFVEEETEVLEEAVEDFVEEEAEVLEEAVEDFVEGEPESVEEIAEDADNTVIIEQEGETMENKKNDTPILSPDIQRLIDEIEGNIPPQEDADEKPPMEEGETEEAEDITAEENYEEEAFKWGGPNISRRSTGWDTPGQSRFRACSHNPTCADFQQISAGCEVKICRRTGVRQKFLTNQATKFAEKTCAWAYVNRP